MTKIVFGVETSFKHALKVEYYTIFYFILIFTTLNNKYIYYIGVSKYYYNHLKIKFIRVTLFVF